MNLIAITLKEIRDGLRQFNDDFENWLQTSSNNGCSGKMRAPIAGLFLMAHAIKWDWEDQILLSPKLFCSAPGLVVKSFDLRLPALF